SAAHATDILVAAVRDGKMPVAELAPVMGNVIPMANRMGVSFDQVAAAMAIVSRTGMDMSTAAVGLNQFFTGLLKPSAKGEKALKSVGLTYTELRADLKKPGGLPAVIQLLNDKFKGNDAALVKVIPNVRALRPLLSILAQDGKTTAGIFDDVANSVGSSNKAFQTAAETDLFKYNKALAQVQTSAIALGGVALPILTDVMGTATKSLSDMTDAWNALTPAQKDSRVESFLWAAGIVAAGLVITKTVIGVGTLVKAYKELQAAAALSSFGAAAGTATVAAGGFALILGAMYLNFVNVKAGLDAADEGTRLYTEAVKTGNYALYDRWAAEKLASDGIDYRRKGVDMATS
ncbi:MAG TPA: phage tail tape measure protein, partial [Candidatus Limnocylindrales bacterium]